jgi:NADH-quinone oxidoreductase subunit N
MSSELFAALQGPLAPLVALVVGAMALLMIGVFQKGESHRLVGWLAVGLLAAVAFLVTRQTGTTNTVFNGAFIDDGFARFVQRLILIGGIGALLLSFTYMRTVGMRAFEYPVLVVLATAGMFMMVSAGDLISLYMGLELQSLALYVIAAIRRDDARSSEAGLKYFVLGALSSGMLLYGCSLLYGFTGSTSFPVIAQAVQAAGATGAVSGTNVGLIFGLVFLLAGLAFKISAVPFHMWAPDVYEGAPTPVTAFFAAAPKVAAMALLTRVVIQAFPGAHEGVAAVAGPWQQIIVFCSIASMILGAVAAIGQNNIKRLMAYSSIGHVGFALVGLAPGTPSGVKGVLIYFTIYLAMTLGTFACILAMRRKGQYVEEISDLAGLSRTNLPMAATLALLMFSLAGIPPLAGFFSKLYVFLPAIEAQFYGLAVVGVLASVVGAFYYLRVIKIMFFDDPAGAFDPMPGTVGLVMLVALFFVVVLGVYPGPLIGIAEAAAQSLF